MRMGALESLLAGASKNGRDYFITELWSLLWICQPIQSDHLPPVAVYRYYIVYYVRGAIAFS